MEKEQIILEGRLGDAQIYENDKESNEFRIFTDQLVRVIDEKQKCSSTTPENTELLYVRKSDGSNVFVLKE